MSFLELRAMLGLNQQCFAELAGVTQPAVAAWEAGRRTPTGYAACLYEAIELAAAAPTFETTGGKQPRLFPQDRWVTVVDQDSAFVKLPSHIVWSGMQNPYWNLSDPKQRAMFYVEVLTNGTAVDIQIYLDADLVVDYGQQPMETFPLDRWMHEPMQQFVQRLQAAPAPA